MNVSDDPWNELNSLIDTGNFVIAGIPTYTVEISDNLLVAQKIKSQNPQIVVIAGGPHATAVPDEVVADASIDIVVHGEGEQTLVDLAKAIFFEQKLDTVQGISYKSGDGKILHTNAREFIANLDELSLPAWHLCAMQKYGADIFGERYLPVNTVRGCPYNCIYCQKNIFGTTTRFRSVKSIIHEIEVCIDTYGVTAFLFTDDTFTLNKNRVNEFLDALRDKKLKITWACGTRVNLVDFDLLKRMAQAGCVRVGLGVESGSQKILELANKKITLQQAEQAVRWAKKAGMYVEAGFMIGFPWDDRQTIGETIDFACKLPVDNPALFITTPYPGTQLRKEAERLGLINESLKWDRYAHYTSSFEASSTMATLHIDGKELVELYTSGKKKLLISKMIQELIHTPHSILMVVKMILAGKSPMSALNFKFRNCVKFMTAVLKKSDWLKSIGLRIEQVLSQKRYR